jgi:hypothetical protein
MSIFDKWNKNIDVEGLKKDVAEAEANGGSGDYKEVPVGKYEVKIDKMELKESSKGDPMFFCQFRILQGDFSNSCLFMNQVLTQGFQIGQVNSFLRSLQVFEDDSVTFENYSQYNDLIMDVMEEVDAQGLEYLLEYKKSKKDFPIYTIKDVYEH